MSSLRYRCCQSILIIINQTTQRWNARMCILRIRKKAVEFAGDNSDYQKKRLFFIAIIILSFAILTCKVAFLGIYTFLLFLAASGLGQLICPVYFTLDICALAIIVISGLSALAFPFSRILCEILFIGLGFFGRGFFACSLLYLNQIGGDRFRAWSLIVIFALWGISSLFSAIQQILSLPTWIWYYGFIFLPLIVCCKYLLNFWKPSPSHLYKLKMYSQAKEVLNDMAEQNRRPPLLYALEGQTTKDDLFTDKNPTYYDLLYQPQLQKITIPLLVLWIFRQYIYYGSSILIPQLSNEYSKNFILISISETVAVLMSYPIRLKIRRVNAFFSLSLMIGISALICSFTTMPAQCMDSGERCTTKFIYRVSIMIIRFAIALIGNIMIGYTIEVYPANVKNTAYSFCLGLSSLGSVLLPWIDASLISWGCSGFIGLAVASVFPLYFTPRLPQTNGRMNNQLFVEWEKRAPLIPLQNWKRIHF